MSKLIRANLARLRKSKLLYIGVALMLGMTLIQIFKSYDFINSNPDIPIAPDRFIFMFTSHSIILTAIFMGFFIGTENGDKTIRNKIIAGHTRTNIYLSYMIVSLIAASVFFLTPSFITLVCGLPLLGSFCWTPEILISSFIYSLFCLIAFVSVFMLIVLLISNKAAASITVLIIAFIMIVMPSYIFFALSEPEIIQDAVIGSDGNSIEFAEVANPDYIGGIPRILLEFILSFLPGCQIYQLGENTLPYNSWLFPIYSLIIITLCSIIGIICFKRKMLK